MLRHELAVEQPESADDEARHQPGQRHLRRIRSKREHALAEEGAAEPHAVEAADKFLILPAFDRMGVTESVEQIVALLDLAVDPGFLALRAIVHDGGEHLIVSYGEGARPDRLAKRAGHAEAVEGDDRAAARLHPEDLVGVATVRHRKHADGVGAQQQVRI